MAMLLFGILRGRGVGEGRNGEGEDRDGEGSASDAAGPRRLKLAARGSWAILSMTAASFLAVCLPAHFWPHYYYLLIPPMVMLCAAGLASLRRPVAKHPPGKVNTSLGVL